MSGSRIKGITVEIGGDTVGLQNALKDVNKRSNDLQRELKDVDKLLRFNPGNVELLAQKQQLLTERIEATSQKLTQLRAAQSQVQAQFERGEIGAEQYRAFRREIETTEGSLNGLQNQLQNMANEQQQVAQSTRELEALFEATGTSVDQFANLLGGRLTESIRNGTATSAQLEEAIDRIGRESVGSGEDLNRLRQILADLGNGASTESVVNEIRRISQQADLSRGSLGDMGVGLEAALQGVNQRSQELQNELKEVERLLKFDSGNVEALAQKQQLLTESVTNTTEKLNQLRAAEQQVQAQFASGSISQEQYRAFRREIEQAEASINQFESALQEMAQEQQRVESSTRQLSTLFDATGTSIDQFADTLGSQLTNAIRNGTASSSQLEEAIRRIGQEALGANTDLDRLRQALSRVDDGANIDEIRRDLDRLADSANEAGESVNNLGAEVAGVAAGIAGGLGLAAAVDEALNMSKVNTKIEISMEVPESSKAAIKDSINTVTSYIDDQEAALEGVRRQWALNKDASDESNAAVVKYAGVIAASFEGVDFTELIQESNEIGAALEMSNEDAMALVNSLLKAGFPPEQLDTISEYGTQMKEAGFSVAEIQAIFEKGVDLKTWNIDNLNDGIKEARLQMASFGSEVPKALKPLLADAGMSEKQFQKWGQSVAEGGEKGSKAMSEVATWLDGIEDKTLKNDIATAVYGTKWEDQGQNMIAVFRGLDEAVDKTDLNMAKLKKAEEVLNADPVVAMRQAFADLKVALEPLLTVIAEVIGKIAEWAQQNPQLLAAIVAIGTVIGILIGVVMALAPIFTAISTAASALGVGFLAVAGPVGIVIAAIAALIAIGVLVWQNWDTIKVKGMEIWGGLIEWFNSTLSSLGSFFSGVWENIKTITLSVWDGIKIYFTTWLNLHKMAFTMGLEIIKTVVSTVWNAIKTVTSTVWDGIKTYFTTWFNLHKMAFTTVFNAIKTIITTVWNAIKTTSETVWNAIKTTITNVTNGIKTTVTTVWEGIKTVTNTVFNAIKTTATTVWNAIKTTVTTVLDGIKSVVTTVWNGIKTTVTTVMNAVKSVITNVWNAAKTVVTTAVNGIKTVVSNVFNTLKTVVSTAMNNVKIAIETGWNKAKSFLEGINLTQIGKDIISGLVNGIGSMVGKVKAKVEELAKNIPAWAKDMLGIHSPSRVMANEVGKWIPEGVAMGIENNLRTVKEASDKMAEAAVPDFASKIAITESELKNLHNVMASAAKNNSKEIEAIEKEAEKKRAEITASTEKKVKDITAKAKASKKGMTAQHHKQIKDLYEKAAKDKEKITADENNKVAKIDGKANADRLAALKDYVEKRKGLKSMTTAQEVAFWDQAVKEFKDGTAEKTQAQINYNKAKAVLDKEQFDKEKSFVDNKKYYNELSLLQELAAYEKYIQSYKDGSDERIHYEKEIYRVKNEIQKQIDQINEDYLSKVKTLNQQLIDEEKKLNDEYQKALDDRAKSLYSFAGIFDEVLAKDVSGDILLQNLQSQVSTIEDWQKNISELASKGINEGLLAELREPVRRSLP